MLPVIDNGLAHDVSRQPPVLECSDQLRDHEVLVYDRFHGEGVVAGVEDEVGEGGVAKEGVCAGWSQSWGSWWCVRGSVQDFGIRGVAGWEL